ncbi:hypothetical protein [Dactylosporangium sp. NPDC049140]|uniref:hypothetical protein n=1 Tax=Dactylosporangium sp. NPDC049140 TaxID=3155647 RepID=UPI00340A128C
MKLILRIAVAGAAYSAGLAGWLLLPGYHPVPMLMWLVAVIGIFPVFGSALLVARRYAHEDPAPGTPTLRRPGAVVAAVFATFAALAVAALVLTIVASAQPLPPGQPVIEGGQYFVNDHGTLTPVSQAVYVAALETGQLGFVSISLVFYLIAVLAVGITGERLAARMHPGVGHR